MPLTHVCVWGKNGWRRITLSEATKLHPIGKVSANSGLFMCELCGQYVTLTQANIRDSYFKHSKQEDDKNCPERTFGSANWQSRYNTLHLDTKGMPIKLIVLDGRNFKFQIGFPALPNNDVNRRNIITIITQQKSSYNYSFERINYEGVTYLDVGSSVSNTYQIKTEDNQFQRYWPSVIKGVSNYSLFEKNSGKKLAVDADVKVGGAYYALTSYEIRSTNHVGVKRICMMQEWKVYEIIPNDLSEDAAKFFLKYFHCRLTDSPINLTLLWPVVVNSPFFTFYKEGSVFALIQGDAQFQLFPNAFIKTDTVENGKLIQTRCNERQQLLSIGRTINILEYTYLQKSDFDYKAREYEISVFQMNQESIENEAIISCPADQTLYFLPKYDGYFIAEREGWIETKIKFNAEKLFRYENLLKGYRYSIIIGHDTVWKCEIKPGISRNISVNSDVDLVNKLRKLNTRKISLSHSFGHIASRMKDYPITKQWLYTQIKKGEISEDAKELLVRLFILGGR